MFNWKKSLALFTALALLAGCSGSPASSGAPSSSQEAGGVAAEPYVPVYTYENPDPDMVLVSAPSGDVTYRDYRLYLDVTEELARYSARQQLALSAAVRQDLSETFGIEVDEEAFRQAAAQEIAMAYFYSPSVFENLGMIGEVTGLTDDEMNDAIIESYRAQYLINQLGTHFQQEAEKEFPAAELPDTIDSGAEDGKAETEAEQERQQKIYEAAAQQMQEYSLEYEERLEFDPAGGETLGTFDGEPIALTEEGSRFVDYMAAASRIEAACFIQEGELLLRALEARDSGIDSAPFSESLELYRQQILGDELLYDELSRICGLFGATVDDYLLALERPLWLQYTGDLYYQALYEEYTALTEGEEEPEQSFEEYVSAAFDKAFEGSELVNLAG